MINDFPDTFYGANYEIRTQKTVGKKLEKYLNNIVLDESFENS